MTPKTTPILMNTIVPWSCLFPRRGGEWQIEGKGEDEPAVARCGHATCARAGSWDPMLCAPMSAQQLTEKGGNAKH